ncbi:unnamed protein product, partial [Prorocentrum cordatum]
GNRALRRGSSPSCGPSSPGSRRPPSTASTSRTRQRGCSATAPGDSATLSRSPSRFRRACASRRSPPMLLPLSHVRGGVCGDHVQPGEPVGHMIVVFAVHSPPEVILRSLKPSPASQVSSIVSSPMGWVAGTSSKRQSAKPTKPKKKASVDAAAAVEKAEAMAQSGQYQELDVSPTAPELDMDGWECRKGPHGQTYWHHQAVGPAPWDAAAPKVSKPQAGTDLLAAAMRLVPK